MYMRVEVQAIAAFMHGCQQPRFPLRPQFLQLAYFSLVDQGCQLAQVLSPEISLKQNFAQTAGQREGDMLVLQGWIQDLRKIDGPGKDFFTIARKTKPALA